MTGELLRERPREGGTVWNIEGRTLMPFRETTMSQSKPILPPGNGMIQWDRAAFLFASTEHMYPTVIEGTPMTIPLFRGGFIYLDDQGTERFIDLSTLTRRPSLFIGSKEGFYAENPTRSGRKDPFYIIGLDFDRLESDIRQMAAVLHELGHAWLYDRVENPLLARTLSGNKSAKIPNLSGLRYYYSELTKHKDNVANFEHVLTIFHERFAWAYGLNFYHDQRLPIGFDSNKGILDYAQYALGTYARGRRDLRFTQGINADARCVSSPKKGSRGLVDKLAA